MFTRPSTSILVVLLAATALAALPERAIADKPTAITFSKSGLTVNGTSFVRGMTIEQLAALLGPWDRKVDLANTIFTWDKLGIYAYRKPSGTNVTELAVSYAPHKLKFEPKRQYEGTLAVFGDKLPRRPTRKDLTSRGFKSEVAAFFLTKRVGKVKAHAEVKESRAKHISLSLVTLWK